MRGSFLFLIGVLINFSCQKEIEKGSFIQGNDLNISSYLIEAERYSKFAKILEETGLFDALNSYNPYGSGFTVFVPTDEAFDNFISESSAYSSFEDLLNDDGFVNILARFHIVLSSYNTNDFPYGSLNDSTITGDYLSMGFNAAGAESQYLINNYARVIDPNIELSNGYVHGLDNVLEPIIWSSYDWLKNQDGVSIFLELLEKTGWSDSMGIDKLDNKGNPTRNRYSLFVEPDTVFQKRGVNSFEDLVELFATPDLPLDDIDNGISKFAAYHIMEQALFLDKLENGIYNTFTSLPIQVSSGSEIRINPGFKIVDTYIQNGDTLFLDYVPILYSISNNPTKNGPVHYISEMLELFKPSAGIITYHFHSEPVIDELKNSDGRYVFEDPGGFQVLNWEGTKNLFYVVGIEAVEAWEDDFIEVSGPFIFTFTTPKIFPGKYNFQIRVHSQDYDNAVIQMYLDGKRIGTSINLKSANGNNDFVTYTIGSVDFLDYSSHEIKINTLIPGTMKLDMIRFEP